MIVCVRTVHVPEVGRAPFMTWIEENRPLRKEHGILLELVLERSARQNPARTLQPSDPADSDEGDLMVLTAWSSHDAFDAWIETPDRDRLTDSDVHRSVEYGPITRFDVVGGYLDLDGLTAVAESPKEER